jgi:hypothetical protein
MTWFKQLSGSKHGRTTWLQLCYKPQTWLCMRVLALYARVSVCHMKHRSKQHCVPVCVCVCVCVYAFACLDALLGPCMCNQHLEMHLFLNILHTHLRVHIQ